LQDYPWPGNIRELQNVIERSVIVCETEEFSIDESWLSRQEAVLPAQGIEPMPVAQDAANKRAAQLKEKTAIEAALAETRGRVSGPRGAAAKLGLRPTTLDARIRSLGIDKHQFTSV
jgi:formate hydrogenlyase transcriptional activator